MINKIHLKDLAEVKILESDSSGEFPIYVFNNKKTIYYSTSLVELLEKVKENLEVSSAGISFLLKSGVIPTPNTIYKDLYIVSIGNTLKIKNVNQEIALDFSRNFPFIRNKKQLNTIPNEKEFLSLLANATLDKLEGNRKNYLFHSAGKDSNTIALALSDQNFEDVHCVSHKSKGESDESDISKKISKRLGFKHQILFEPSTLENKHLDSIEDYFTNISFPVMDVVSLAYPIYNTQLDFTNSNIIDGMGNDVYIGHIPSVSEYRFANYLSKISFMKPLTNKLNSENYLNILGANKIEWVGLIGLMNGDCTNIYNEFEAIDKDWKNIENESKNLNYFDFRAKIRGGIIDQEIFMRKVRNFGDINNSNIIFPWADSSVANYFYNVDDKYLFDKKNLKNKLILRDLLNKRLGLDSDKLGKLGYTFDFWKILNLMSGDVKNEILTCKLWNVNEVEVLLKRLYRRGVKNDRFANRARSLIHRLYLLSAWHNKNKYVNRDE